MSCQQYLEALTEAALGGVQDAALRSHLAGCAGCRNELDRLRTLTAAMDRSIMERVNVEPSPGFSAGVRQRLAEESAARAAWWRAWVPALTGAVAVLALVAWLLWPDAQLSTPPGVPVMAKDEPVAPLQAAPEAPDKNVAPAPPGPERREVASVRRLPVPVRPQRETPAKPALPEVLVSGDEWNQVVNLYALAQQGQIEAKVVAAPDTTPLEEKFQPLMIARMDPIKPLQEPSAGEPRR
jgi:hypothetical protein